MSIRRENPIEDSVLGIVSPQLLRFPARPKAVVRFPEWPSRGLEFRGFSGDIKMSALLTTDSNRFSPSKNWPASSSGT